MKDITLIQEKQYDHFFSSTHYLSIKDFLDINCFAINKRINVYAISNEYIYTLMRNIPEKMLRESLKIHHPIRVRNLQQLNSIKKSINISKIILDSDNSRIIEIKDNLPGWIKERFLLILKKDKIILLSKDIHK